MSRSSVASADRHDPRHIELLRLSSSGGKFDQIRNLLEGSEWTTEKDRDALRLALQKVASLGDEALCRYLILKGADVNVKKHDDADGPQQSAPGDGAALGAEDATSLTAGQRPGSATYLDDKAAENRTVASNTKSNRGPKMKPAEVSALIRAAERGRPGVVKILLENGADTEARDSNGRTALFPAALFAYIGVEVPRKQKKLFQEQRPKSLEQLEKEKAEEAAKKAAVRRQYLEVVRLLLAAKANVDARDKDERTPLIHLAAEKGESVEQDVVVLLLTAGADVEAFDNTEQRRNALQWAAATGKFDFAGVLLSGVHAKKADVNASNDRGRRALHFAAENGQDPLVRLLLANGADPRAQSTGGWTALHNAAQLGRYGCAAIMLEPQHDIDVNAKLYNGMTALHWAAYNGHEDVALLIIACRDVNISIKDSFDRTAMLCAAEKGHARIVDLLCPSRNGSRLHEKARMACKEFEATVVDFGMNLREGRQRRFRYNVFELLYGWDAEHNRARVTTAIKYIPHKPAFRWIHLPANNVAWVEALLAKHFVESGHRDIDDFKAIEKCFSQEHRGPTVHAHFMRSFCHQIRVSSPETDDPTPLPQGTPHRPSLTLTEPDQVLGNQLPTIPEPPKSGTATPTNNPPNTPKKSSIPNGTVDKENAPPTPTTEEKKKTKSEKRAERFVENHAKKPKSKGQGPQPNKQHKGSADPRRSQARQPSGKVITRMPGGAGKIVFFMPFLHYETDERRQRMAAAIKKFRIENLGNTAKRIATDENPDLPRAGGPVTRDDLLIEAYLNHSPPLHPRRTLDQYFYHGIDTTVRDQDQVVYRYCEKRGLERKVFMVDQLWMYIIGNELIITSFPQRWQQPKNDPLNVLEGIIEDTNAKTRPPIKSVYDLAMLITTRCCGMFDRHLPDKEEFQFVDMFESSIGRVTNRETELFDRFNRASKKAAEWLKQHRGGRGGQRTSMTGKSADSLDPEFQDDLLDIGTETELLAEIKDIRDEIQMIRSVLTSQLNYVPDLADRIKDEIQGGPREKRPDEWFEVERRKEGQKKLLETHLADLKRMDEQAGLIYNSLTNLLDLKQKHANAFEARFARDQASLTARQGQTIMVFTIVTIVFLPMSFIASFFAINFENFTSKAAGGGPSLTIAYVSRYMFGIGLGISVPLIIFALAVDDLRRWHSQWRRSRAAAKAHKDKLAKQQQQQQQQQQPKQISDDSTDDADEKMARVSTASRPPAARDFAPYAHEFAPPYRTTSNHTHLSWRQSYERRRMMLRASDDVV